MKLLYAYVRPDELGNPTVYFYPTDVESMLRHVPRMYSQYLNLTRPSIPNAIQQKRIRKYYRSLF